MSLARQTLLLIEDDQNDIQLLQRIFRRQRAGKPIQTVSNGEQAIAYLSGADVYADRQTYPLPKLVFLDLKLPGISGFEVLDWIRRQTGLRRVRVVVLTGSKRSLDIYRAFELGANSYLVKPIQRADIANLARSLNLPWLNLAESPVTVASSFSPFSAA